MSRDNAFYWRRRENPKTFSRIRPFLSDTYFDPHLNKWRKKSFIHMLIDLLIEVGGAVLYYSVLTGGYIFIGAGKLIIEIAKRIRGKK